MYQPTTGATPPDSPALVPRAERSTTFKGDPPPTACPRPITKVDPATGEILYTFGCGNRTCEVCGLRRKWSHVAHYTERFKGLPWPLAVTLTLDPASVVDPRPVPYKIALVETWKSAVKALGQRCSRAGGRLYCLGVVEYDEERRPHIHATMSCPIEGAEEAIAEVWYKQGGGSVHKVEPVVGGDRGLAGWISYSFKEHFYPGTPSYELLTSKDGWFAYGSAAAKAERRAHVEVSDDYVTYPWLRNGEEAPVTEIAEEAFSPETDGLPETGVEPYMRELRRRPPRPAPSPIDQERRRATFDDRLKGTDYGVRTSFTEAGRIRRSVVRFRTGPAGAEVREVIARDFGSATEAVLRAAALASCPFPLDQRAAS